MDPGPTGDPPEQVRRGRGALPPGLKVGIHRPKNGGKRPTLSQFLQPRTGQDEAAAKLPLAPLFTQGEVRVRYIINLR